MSYVVFWVVLNTKGSSCLLPFDKSIAFPQKLIKIRNSNCSNRLLSEQLSHVIGYFLSLNHIFACKICKFPIILIENQSLAKKGLNHLSYSFYSYLLLYFYKHKDQIAYILFLNRLFWQKSFQLVI